MASAKSQSSFGIGADYPVDAGTSNVQASFSPGTVDSEGLFAASARMLRQLQAVADALAASDAQAWTIFRTETTYDLGEVKDALFGAVAAAALVLGGTTAIGTAIGAVGGAFAGGAGAVPGAVIGAEVGFEAGISILNWLGLAFLIVYVVERIGDVTNHFRLGVATAWDAGATNPRSEPGVTEGAAQIGRAKALLVRLILEGVALAIAAKGLAAVAGALRSSRLGAGFAAWVEKNAQKLAEHPRYQPKPTGGPAGAPAEGASSPPPRAQPKSAAPSGGSTAAPKPPAEAKPPKPVEAKAPAADREIDVSRKSLQKKYKHAADFGVDGPYNSANAAKFEQAVRSHVADPGTEVISGTYRGQPVTHYVNPESGLNVVKDASGEFVSGWKLSPAQLEHVTTTGKLGGG